MPLVGERLHMLPSIQHLLQSCAVRIAISFLTDEESEA